MIAVVANRLSRVGDRRAGPLGGKQPPGESRFAQQGVANHASAMSPRRHPRTGYSYSPRAVAVPMWPLLGRPEGPKPYTVDGDFGVPRADSRGIR